MVEQRIKCGEIELGVIAKRIHALNAAQAELNKAAELGNETFSLFCAARSLPQTAQFVKIEDGAVVVSIPSGDTTPAATAEPGAA
jgi:hypothetical protein